MAMTVDNFLVDAVSQRDQLISALKEIDIEASDNSLIDSLVIKVADYDIGTFEFTGDTVTYNSNFSKSTSNPEITFYKDSGILIINGGSSAISLTDLYTSLERPFSMYEDRVEYVFLNNISSIGKYYLADLKNCKLIYDISGSCKTVAANGCENNINLLYTNIFDTVTSYGESAFAGCEKLGSIVFGTTASVGSYAFANCLNASVISGAVSSIGEYAFANCASLRKITTEKFTATSWAANVCNGCSSLLSVVIPSITGLTIDSTAFKNCDELTTFTALGSTPSGSPWGATNATVV